MPSLAVRNYGVIDHVARRGLRFPGGNRNNMPLTSSFSDTLTRYCVRVSQLPCSPAFRPMLLYSARNREANYARS